MLAATGWIAARLITKAAEDPIGKRLAAAARFWLSDLDARASLYEHDALTGALRLGEFQHIQDLT
jgi:3-(methylthio)propanoyl-CoA dehydrogenase